MPANTFAATAFAVLGAGGQPVFADIDPDTAALSPAAVEAALTDRTAAVVLVHIGGVITPAITELQELCARARRPARRGRRARPRLRARRRPGRLVRGRRRVLLLPDEGRHQRRGRHDRHRGRGAARRGAGLPRPGQGGLRGQPAHPRRLRVADQRAARRGRGGAPAPARRVRRGAPPRRAPLHRRAGGDRRRHPAAGAGRVAQQRLQVRRDAWTTRCRATRSSRCSPTSSGCSCPARCTTPRCTSSRCSVTWPAAPLPGAERFCARHVCLPVHSDMTDAEADRVLGALDAALRELRR